MFRAGCSSLRVSNNLISKNLGLRSYSTKPHGIQTLGTGAWEKAVYKGYNVQSFIPHKLPPQVNLSFVHPAIGISLSESLIEADENLAELRRKAVEVPSSMHSSFMKKEAVGSCQIDLNSRSLTGVVKEACGFKPPRSSHERQEFEEMMQYIEASQLGLRLTEKEPLSVETIETIHKASTVEKPGQMYSAEVVPGKIRTSQIAVGGGNSSPPYSSVFFPPPPKHLRGLLDNLVDFVNNPSELHPLLKVGIAHAQFETIHPFMQGNGQLGRLLLMLNLLQTKVVDQYTFYPSYAFKVCRWLYFNSLQDTRNSGTWEPWLQFFVGSISHSARDAIELCEDLAALHQRNKKAIMGNNRREDIDEKKTDKLLDVTYRMPYITKQTVALLFSENYSVAHEMLDLFTRRGILEIVRDERNEIWYHNRAVVDELNKERHIAAFVSLMGGWMRMPPKIEVDETIETVETVVQETFSAFQEGLAAIPVHQRVL